MTQRAAIPVTVLTGFLGSGKTTLLNRLLARPEFAKTIVIINEFGEIGLDHLLVERSDENLTLLNNGCLCCTVRGDLVATMRDLAERQAAGAIGGYDRMIIETTGLADPAPILHTLMADPAVTDHHRLAGIVTTVDAVNGLRTLERHIEAVKQAAVADRLLLTKCDLADAETTAALRQRLGGLNYAAPVIEVIDGRAEPADLFDGGLYDVSSKPETVRAWLGAEKAAEDRGHHHHGHAHDVNRHDDHVKAYCITLEKPVRWEAFCHWLELMAAMRGEQLLRVKGIVAIAEEREHPVVIHGVQHIFHPPVRLDAWPSQDRRTRLVFITRDVPQELIASTLQKFGAVESGQMSVT